MQQHVRLAADADASGIDNDGFHATRPGGYDVVSENKRCRTGVVAPQKERFAVREIRRREVSAKGKAEAGVPVPIADVGCGDPVGAAEDIEEARQPAHRIID